MLFYFNLKPNFKVFLIFNKDDNLHQIVISDDVNNNKVSYTTETEFELFFAKIDNNKSFEQMKSYLKDYYINRENSFCSKYTDDYLMKMYRVCKDIFKKNFPVQQLLLAEFFTYKNPYYRFEFYSDYAVDNNNRTIKISKKSSITEDTWENTIKICNKEFSKKLLEKIVSDEKNKQLSCGHGNALSSGFGNTSKIELTKKNSNGPFGASTTTGFGNGTIFGGTLKFSTSPFSIRSDLGFYNSSKNITLLDGINFITYETSTEYTSVIKLEINGQEIYKSFDWFIKFLHEIGNIYYGLDEDNNKMKNEINPDLIWTTDSETINRPFSFNTLF